MDKAAPAVQSAKRQMLQFPKAFGECSAQVSDHRASPNSVVTCCGAFTSFGIIGQSQSIATVA